MVAFSRIEMSTRKGGKKSGGEKEAKGKKWGAKGLGESRGGTALSTLSFILHMRRCGEKATQVEEGVDASGSPTSETMQKEMGKGKGRAKRAKVLPSHPGRGRKPLAFREA